MIFRFPLALIASIAAVPAAAASIQPFTTAAFLAAQRAGEPILVDVHADWCPTCRRQAPTIQAISKDRTFARLRIFKLDFDTQTAEWKALRVNRQSTLIVFHGRREVGRAIGIVDPTEIRALSLKTFR